MITEGMVPIGGHRASSGVGPGVHVFRMGNGVIRKEAHTPEDVLGLRNEARLLRILGGTGIAPKMFDEGDDWITQEDLGESESVQDGENFRRNAAHTLWTLREHKIRHGDLTGVNVIIKDDWPRLIDFAQSNLFDEPIPDKRKLSDSYYLWRTVSSFPSVEHPTPDTPRVIRRWLAVLGALEGLRPDNPLVGKTLLDLGCFQGDFCAMAAADGMVATGVDSGGFQSGENSIQRAIDLWDGMRVGTLVRGCFFYQQNIMDWTQFGYDAVFLFSTWAYILNDYGRDAAFALLDRIVKSCGVLFFETQLAGDGPGPDFLVTDDDVANMLGQFGSPQPLVTIPVAGRPASRTVWQVKK